MDYKKRNIADQFRAAFRQIVKKNKRGFQAKICKETGLAPSQIGDILSGRRGSNEDQRRIITLAINNTTGSSYTYSNILDLGQWCLTGNNVENWKPRQQASLDVSFPSGDVTFIAETIRPASTTEPTTPHVRNYREIAEIDDDILKEIQTWLNDMEKYRPGFTAWFRLEFQNRFPEFDDWKKKQFKKAE